MTVSPTALLKDKETLALLEQPGQQWATPVTGWTVETGEDSLDHPTILVRILLATNQKFDLETSQEEFDKLDVIRKQVWQRITKSGDHRWVYVRFRTKAGQAELAE